MKDKYYEFDFLYKIKNKIMAKRMTLYINNAWKIVSSIYSIFKQKNIGSILEEASNRIVPERLFFVDASYKVIRANIKLKNHLSNKSKW